MVGQAKTEEWMQSAQNTADRTCDKMADSKESAQQGKEQSAGFIQQVLNWPISPKISLREGYPPYRLMARESLSLW